jgi:hypothetical protein
MVVAIFGYPSYRFSAVDDGYSGDAGVNGFKASVDQLGMRMKNVARAKSSRTRFIDTSLSR